MVGRARVFALHAYGNEELLAHPLEVAGLVDSVGYPEDVVAAAVLHDVIEDTAVDDGEIVAEFGSRVAALVSTLTEDESIRSYSDRKADLRRRACAAGQDAALISVADKLSNVRRMRRREKDPKQRKIAHYDATLAMLREKYPACRCWLSSAKSWRHCAPSCRASPPEASHGQGVRRPSRSACRR